MRKLIKLVKKLRKEMDDLTDRIAARKGEAPDSLPSVVENEERALRAVTRAYEAACRDLNAADAKATQAAHVVVNLTDVSTEELKRRLKDAKE